MDPTRARAGLGAPTVATETRGRRSGNDRGRMSERVLILGGSGLLGRALLRCVPPGHRAGGSAPEETCRSKSPSGSSPRCGMRKPIRFLLVAAWTAVDACEADPERAFRLNGILAGQAAGGRDPRRRADRVPLDRLRLRRRVAASLPRVRPGGAAQRLRAEQVGRRVPRARRGAGRAHRAHLRALRPGGPDFVQAIRAALQRGPVEVVTDEVNAPTFVDDLAPALWTLALAGAPGTWHLAAAGEVSRFDCARRIAELVGPRPGAGAPDDPGAVRPARPRVPPIRCSTARPCAPSSASALPPWEDGLAPVSPGCSSGDRATGGVHDRDPAQADAGPAVDQERGPLRRGHLQPPLHRGGRAARGPSGASSPSASSPRPSTRSTTCATSRRTGSTPRSGCGRSRRGGCPRSARVRADGRPPARPGGRAGAAAGARLRRSRPGSTWRSTWPTRSASSGWCCWTS